MAFIYIIIILSAGAVFYLYNYIIVNTQKSRRRTLDDVYTDEELKEKYSIGENRTPLDYGLEYEEVSFQSSDNIPLKGWYIKGGSKAIIISHGRSGNRLNVMEYLELLRDTGKFKEYSVLIYDLRNGGQSPPAPTGIGELFRLDIGGAIHFMKEKGHKTFYLWGFSMGAMATLKALEDYMDKEEIEVEGIILDSPLSNGGDILAYSFIKEGHSRFVSRLSVFFYNIHMRGKLGEYSMSRLINKLDLRTLILQSKEDIITPYDIFIRETSILDWEKAEVEEFEHGKHLYLRRTDKKRYDSIINNFIKGGSSGS